MTNRFNRSRLGVSIVSIVLEIHKREDNRIPSHFILDIKKKRYDVIEVSVFPSNSDFLPKKGSFGPYYTTTPQKISNLQEKNNNK